MKFSLIFLSLASLVVANPVDVDERDVSIEARREFVATAKPPEGVTLKCRKGPATSYEERTTFDRGEDITIKCQTSGEDINGNAIWNKIDRTLAFDCYVSDYYTSTGFTWIPEVPRCDG